MSVSDDVDTLHQMLSQSIPQLVSSVDDHRFGADQYVYAQSAPDGCHAADGGLDVSAPRRVNYMSGKFFLQRQRRCQRLHRGNDRSQKVVKVFTHEQKTLEGFRKLNGPS